MQNARDRTIASAYSVRPTPDARVSTPLEWGEVLRPMNKTSDNPVTRMLFLQLGVPLMAAHPQATTAELAGRECPQLGASEQFHIIGAKRCDMGGGETAYLCGGE